MLLSRLQYANALNPYSPHQVALYNLKDPEDQPPKSSLHI